MRLNENLVLVIIIHYIFFKKRIAHITIAFIDWR